MIRERLLALGASATFAIAAAAPVVAQPSAIFIDGAVVGTSRGDATRRSDMFSLPGFMQSAAFYFEPYRIVGDTSGGLFDGATMIAEFSLSLHAEITELPGEGVRVRFDAPAFARILDRAAYSVWIGGGVGFDTRATIRLEGGPARFTISGAWRQDSGRVDGIRQGHFGELIESGSVVDSGTYEFLVDAIGASTSDELPDDVFNGWLEADFVTPCLADFNFDGTVNSQDFFDFLACFFDPDNCPAADFNRDGTIDSQDFFDFLAAFFAGCG